MTVIIVEDPLGKSIGDGTLPYEPGESGDKTKGYSQDRVCAWLGKLYKLEETSTKERIMN